MEEKLFVGAGTVGEAALDVHIGVFQWTILGLRLSAIYETGDFASFRKYGAEAGRSENLYPYNGGISISRTTGYDFNLRKMSFGLFTLGGYTYTGSRDVPWLMHMSAGLHFTSREYTVIAQCVMAESGITAHVGLAYATDFRTLISLL
jgi:hypothetical protein